MSSGGRRRQQFRKRKALDEQDKLEEDQDDGALSLKEKLADTKLLQKHRARSKGLDASSLAFGQDTKQYEDDTRAKGMLGDAIDLSAAFNKEELVDEEAEDPNMKKFVDKEMARLRGKTVGEEEDPNDPARQRRLEEEDLYRIPEDLQVAKKGDDGQIDLGASGTAGIQEVALSIDYKLKNIEQTEAAKKALLEQSALKANIKDPFAEDGLPTNFKDIGANATRDMFVRQFGKDQWRGPSGNSCNRANRGRARDDDVVAKFKRDQRARFRR